MTTKKKTPTEGHNWVSTFLLKAASSFGVSGAAILSIIATFFIYGTDTQKQEFIDRFILLKILTENKDYSIFVIVLLVIVLLAQSIFYYKKNKLKDERIKSLEADIEKLQIKLLKR